MIRIIAILMFLFSMALTIGYWNYEFGFQPLNKEWWVWLVKTIVAEKMLPMPLLLPLIISFGSCFSVLMILLVFLKNTKNRVIFGGFNTKNIQGSATWASIKDIKLAGLWKNKNGVIVGGYSKSSMTKTERLLHNGPEHILCFAPTRSGKGVGLVIPTLLTWEHSVLSLDIKGENFALTSGWRKSIGQNILKFEPTAKDGCSRFNPLAEVRYGDEHIIEDCQNIAMMIVDPDGKGLKDIWGKGAYSWLYVILLHVVCKVKLEEKRDANLLDISNFIGRVAEAGEEVDLEESFNGLCDDMTSYDHGFKFVDDAVKREATNMRQLAHETRTGIHKNVQVELGLYSDPIVARNISGTDWKISDLMNADNPTSLYLVIPPKDIDRLKPLFRIILNQILRQSTAEMQFSNGASVKSYKHRMLLMLDEFTSIGKLEIFEQSLAFMAGYGLKAFIIIQDITQLHKAYTKDESVISNCHIRIAYAPNKIETAKVLSEMAGKTTVIEKKKSASGKVFEQKNTSFSESQTARSLLTPDECMRLKGLEKDGNGNVKSAGDMIIFPAGFNPIFGRQILFFKEKDFMEKSKIPSAEILAVNKIELPKNDNSKSNFNFKYEVKND